MRRVLIVGSGDVAQRAIPYLAQRYRVYALVRRWAAAAPLRAAGAIPILADLDTPGSLQRVAGLADIIFHFAPPPANGTSDVRTRRLVAALARRGSLPRRLVYISTTGVYGDCSGEKVSEARPLRPTTPRAQRRVDAERVLRAFAARTGARLSILRAPGIYAAERLSLDRLRRGDPVLLREEDVFTNHIHADDLARAAVAAHLHGAGGRTFNVSDDSELLMGDYYDAMADIFGLARPPRASRQACAERLSSMTLSFMAESRRICNARMATELGVQLRYPDVIEALRQIQKTAGVLAQP